MSDGAASRTLQVGLCAALALALAAHAGAEDADGAAERPVFHATAVFNLPATRRPLEVLDGRLVLLVFFAPWSERCIEAVPLLNKLHDAHSGRGLTILAVAEAEPDLVEAWVSEHGAKFPVALMGTSTNERLSKRFAVPGMPHGVLLSPEGEVLLANHPGYVKARNLRPHLTGIRTPPPLLPVALGEQQKLLEDGLWGAARASLEAGLDGLDRISKQWARGLIEFVDDRHGTWLTEAEAHAVAGRHWDAWQMFHDFPRRFEGLEGADVATKRAGEIRADPAAARDLEAGDLVQKARDLLAKGDTKRATLVLKRIVRSFKKSAHAARARALLATLP